MNYFEIIDLYYESDKYINQQEVINFFYSVAKDRNVRFYIYYSVLDKSNNWIEFIFSNIYKYYPLNESEFVKFIKTLIKFDNADELEILTKLFPNYNWRWVIRYLYNLNDKTNSAKFMFKKYKNYLKLLPLDKNNVNYSLVVMYNAKYKKLQKKYAKPNISETLNICEKNDYSTENINKIFKQSYLYNININLPIEEQCKQLNNKLKQKYLLKKLM